MKFDANPSMNVRPSEGSTPPQARSSSALMPVAEIGFTGISTAGAMSENLDLDRCPVVKSCLNHVHSQIFTL